MTRELQASIIVHPHIGYYPLRALLLLDLVQGKTVSDMEVAQSLGCRLPIALSALDKLKGMCVVRPEEGHLWFVQPKKFWKLTEIGHIPSRLFNPSEPYLIEPDVGMSAVLSSERPDPASAPSLQGCEPVEERYDLSRAKALFFEDAKDGGCRVAEYEARTLFGSRPAVPSAPTREQMQHPKGAAVPSAAAQLVPSSVNEGVAAERELPPPRGGGAQLASYSLSKLCTTKAQLSYADGTPNADRGPDPGEAALGILERLSPGEFSRFGPTWRGAAKRNGAELLRMALFAESEVRARAGKGNAIGRPLAYLLPRAKEKGLV